MAFRIRETTFRGRAKEFGKDLLWPLGFAFGSYGADWRKEMLRAAPEGEALKAAYEAAGEHYQSRLSEAYRVAYPDDADITANDLNLFRSFALGSSWRKEETARVKASLEKAFGSSDGDLKELSTSLETAKDEWFDVGSGWDIVIFVSVLAAVVTLLRAAGRQLPKDW